MSRLRVPALHQRVYHADDPALSFSHPIPTPPHTPPSSANDHSLPPYASSPSLFPTRRTLQHHTDSPTLWLTLYFTLNLALTLYNKSMLSHFPFPYTLTALHALCGSVGTWLLLRTTGRANRDTGPGTVRASWPRRAIEGIPRLNARETVVLLLFSVLYTVNIVLSNVSLRLVTVPFHQVVRALSPFFTIVLSSVLLDERTQRTKLIPLIPVVAGVGLATYGDYYFTPYGFFLTLLGTILASVKTVLTNLLQSSSPTIHVHSSPPASPSPLLRPPPPSRPKKPPHTPSPYVRGGPPTPSSTPSLLPTLPKLHLTSLQLLAFLSPLACVQSFLLAWVSGELSRARMHFALSRIPSSLVDSSSAPTEGETKVHMQVVWLLLNGVLAFCLNVASFGANRRAGPLGMSVAANVKQVLTVLIAVTLFDLTITRTNALGVVLTLVGGAWYTQVELRDKQQRKKLAREKD